MKKITAAALIACSALLALGLAGCIVPGNGGNGGGNGGTDPTPAVYPTPEPSPTPTLSVTVEDDYSYSGIYKDPDFGEIPFAFVLPKVTGPDTDYIAEINTFIAKLRQDAESSRQYMEAGNGMGYVSIEYQAHAVEDMISIIFTWRNAYENDTNFKTFLIKADGTKAENTALFAAKGVTADQVLAKVREQLEAIDGPFDYDAIVAMAGKEMADLAKEANDKTFSDANISTHMPFYINDEGRLAVAATYYTIAGAGHKTYFLDLGF